MSPQLKPFEGPDVQALLDEIRAEVGPHAKINGAEKVRVGGVLGFFAREHYRVTVELPAEGSAPEAEVFLGVGDLVAPGGPSRVDPPVGAWQPEDVFASMAAATDDRNDVTTLARWRDEAAQAAMADAGLARDGMPTRRAPEATPPAGASFGDVLTRVAADIDRVGAAEIDTVGAAEIDTDTTVRVGTRVPVGTGSPSKGARSLDAATLDTATLDTATLDTATLDTATLDAGSLDPGSLDAGSLDIASFDPGTSLATAATGGPTAAGRPGDGAREVVIDPGDAPVGRHSIGRHASPRPAADPPAPTAVAGAAAVSGRLLMPDASGADDRLADSLRAAGIAPEVATRVSAAVRCGADLETQLVDVFSSLPVARPLPTRAGSLVVVVGPGQSVRDLAATVAAEAGVDAGTIPFASPDAPRVPRLPSEIRVRSADEAAERAVGWRRYHLAVVAVEAPMVGPKRDWARHVIAALAPTAVLGIASATSKSEDIAAWATAIGGIDALAVEDLDSTVSPAAVLSVGLPVARLDGATAGPARWAATVVDRLGPWR